MPIWCYAVVNNWEFRLKRRMNPSDVILFFVSEDLCLPTHQASPDWPVFTFCRCHFPLGYWCASLPRKPALSMHFVKLTPWAHTSFCCTVGKEECLWRGTLNISVMLFLGNQERQTDILLHILLIQIPGSSFGSQERQGQLFPMTKGTVCIIADWWLKMAPKVKTHLSSLNKCKWKVASLIVCVFCLI